MPSPKPPQIAIPAPLFHTAASITHHQDPMKFDILSQQNLYKGFFRVDAYEFRHELFAGGWSGTVRREIFERRNAVAVLLHDPVADTLLIIEQFRPGAALRDAQFAWMVEIVAGIVEDGESNEDVARREAQEEAGCSIDTVEHIIDFYRYSEPIQTYT